MRTRCIPSAAFPWFFIDIQPVNNEEFEVFAEHYGCAVYPARVHHPRDKSLVENAVRLMYRSVYADIEGLTFRGLDSLNSAIRGSLEKFNAARMASREPRGMGF